VWKKGFKFTVYYFTGSKELEIILKQYAVKLKLINPKFNLIVKGVSWKYYLQYLLQNKLVVIASGWVADYYDSYDFIYPYMYSEGLYGKELGLLYRSW
jgi:peptide/nickel transport system substrate-binding protein